VGVLYFLECKIFFPVLALFRERRRAEAHFNPLNTSVVELARSFHVAEIFIAGDRSAAEHALNYGASEGF